MGDLRFDDFKVKPNVRDTISFLLFKLEDYRQELEYAYGDKRKIRCRLFYEGDDLPDDLWTLPLPENHDARTLWSAHLLLEEHFGRIGIYEEFSEDEGDLRDPWAKQKYFILFEDPNDLLTFKLTVPR